MVVVGGNDDDAKEGKHASSRPAICFMGEPSRLQRNIYGDFRGPYQVQHTRFSVSARRRHSFLPMNTVVEVLDIGMRREFEVPY